MFKKIGLVVLTMGLLVCFSKHVSARTLEEMAAAMSTISTTHSQSVIDVYDSIIAEITNGDTMGVQANAYYYGGNVYLGIGNTEKALDYFIKSEAAFRKNKNAFYRFAQAQQISCYFHLGNNEKVIAIGKAILAENFDYCAYAYMVTGDFFKQIGGMDIDVIQAYYLACLNAPEHDTIITKTCYTAINTPVGKKQIGLENWKRLLSTMIFMLPTTNEDGSASVFINILGVLKSEQEKLK